MKKKILNIIQNIDLICPNGEILTIQAKLDTGAYSSSIDIGLVKKYNFLYLNKKKEINSASGKTLRPIYECVFILSEKKIITEVVAIDRSNLKFPMIIGRRNMSGFFIRPRCFSNSNIDVDQDTELIISDFSIK